MFKKYQQGDNLESEQLAQTDANSRLQKCISATQFNNRKTRSPEQKGSYIRRTISISSQGNQGTEFTFFLKLKMINLIRLLNDEGDNFQKKLSQDPNQLLSILGKKINNFHKAAKKKQSQLQRNVKELQIKCIDFETIIKALQTQLNFQKTKADKVLKSHGVQIAKYQQKIMVKEIQLTKLEKKVNQTIHINEMNDKQNRKLRSEKEEIKLNLQESQKTLFQLQKKMKKQKNYETQTHNHFKRQIDQLKDQILKFSLEKTELKEKIIELEQKYQRKQEDLGKVKRQKNELEIVKQKIQRQLTTKITENHQLKTQKDKINRLIVEKQTKMEQKMIKLGEKVEQFDVKMEKSVNIFNKIKAEAMVVFEQVSSQIKIVNSYETKISQTLQKMKRINENSIKILKEEHQLQVRQHLNEVEWKNSRKVGEMEERHYKQIERLKKQYLRR